MPRPRIAITTIGPFYSGVAKVIVRSKFEHPVANVENALNIALVDATGKEMIIATLYGRFDRPSTHPIEVEAPPSRTARSSGREVNGAPAGTSLPRTPTMARTPRHGTR